MRLSEISSERRQVLKRIEEYEKTGRFHQSVENDPPSKELKPKDVDYLCKRVKSKVCRRLANMLGDHYYLRQMRKGKLLFNGVEGVEYLSALSKGAIVTCNHFCTGDHYIAFHALRPYLPRKYLYKIIREGNYTGFSGLYGFLFRHCDTLPLSSNRRTMIDFMSAVQTLLKRGESILIYPEQEMWFQYRKPRPFIVGGFKIAYRANVPVVPLFITMQDVEGKTDEHGYPLQQYTVHVLPPVYPDAALGERGGAEKMKEQAYALYKEKYEQVYGEPLTFACD